MVTMVVLAVVFFVLGGALVFFVKRAEVLAAGALARQGAEQEIVVLREQARAKDETLAEVRRTAEERSRAIDEEKSRVLALTGDLASARSEAERAAGLKAALDDAGRVAAAAQEEASKAAVRAAEATARAAEVEAGAAERKAALDAAVAEAEVQRKSAGSLGERVVKSEAEAVASAARVVELSAEVATTKKTLATRDEEFGAFRKAAADVQANLAKVTADLAGTEKRRQDAAAEAQAAREDGKKLQTEVDAARKALGVTQADLAKVRADLDAAQKRTAEAVAEVQVSREDGKKLQAEVDATRKTVAATQADLAKTKAALDASEKRAGEALAEVGVLRKAAEGLQAEVKKLVEERTRLATDLDAERKAAEERKAEATKNHEQLLAQVEKVAGRMLETKGEAMVARNKEGLDALLKPVAEKLRDFEQKVEKTYDSENRDRASLRQQLETLQKAQEQLHGEAARLSKALTRDSKQQGDWGELVLENVLDAAGLTAGRDYDMQVSRADEDGNQKRPDALVYLPNNRAIIVDSKCSLTAFIDAAGAANEEEREAALDAHVASLRGHIKDLASKNYPASITQHTIDTVMLFVPNEAAFHAAMSRVPNLHTEAFREGVVLTSPTTLLAAMQLVTHVWRSERQNLNATKIAEEAGKLLEKLAGFVESLDSVGNRLDQARGAFDDARKKLSEGKGNLLGRAKTIARLGARVTGKKAVDLLSAGEAEDDEGESGEGGQLLLGKGEGPEATA